jgi:neutral trehalase
MVMVVDGLKKYGYDDIAEKIGRNYLEGVMREFSRTGSLWEKYVATGTAEKSPERYANARFHGWSSASVVVIGRMIGLTEPGSWNRKGRV